MRFHAPQSVSGCFRALPQSSMRFSAFPRALMRFFALQLRSRASVRLCNFSFVLTRHRASPSFPTIFLALPQFSTRLLNFFRISTRFRNFHLFPRLFAIFDALPRPSAIFTRRNAFTGFSISFHKYQRFLTPFHRPTRACVFFCPNPRVSTSFPDFPCAPSIYFLTLKSISMSTHWFS